MGHGACYFKAWEPMGKRLLWPKKYWSFEQTRIFPCGRSFSSGLPLSAKRPHGNYRGKAPVGDRLSVGAVMWSRGVGSLEEKGSYLELSALCQ